MVTATLKDRPFAASTIASMHNAALGAEREDHVQTRADLRKLEEIHYECNPKIDELEKALAFLSRSLAASCEQLAAEREDRISWQETALKEGNRSGELAHQLVAEREKVKELAEALRMLRDYQNGCPLPSYEKGWNEAMSMTNAVLAKVEEVKSNES